MKKLDTALFVVPGVLVAVGVDFRFAGGGEMSLSVEATRLRGPVAIDEKFLYALDGTQYFEMVVRDQCGRTRMLDMCSCRLEMQGRGASEAGEGKWSAVTCSDGQAARRQQHPMTRKRIASIW